MASNFYETVESVIDIVREVNAAERRANFARSDDGVLSNKARRNDAVNVMYTRFGKVIDRMNVSQLTRFALQLPEQTPDHVKAYAQKFLDEKPDDDVRAARDLLKDLLFGAAMNYPLNKKCGGKC